MRSRKLKYNPDWEKLANYIPSNAQTHVVRILEQYNVQLIISRSRRTKLGDYRAPVKTYYHRISVNHDLNPYLFLITLMHEIAHMQVWIKHKNRVKPHGKEWKEVFQNLMYPFLSTDVFPEEILEALKKYLQNSSAASGSNLQLSRALKKYNTQQSLVLEDLEDGAIFSISDGRIFMRLEKLRKRYRCKNLHNKRLYLINALTEVSKVNIKE